MVVRCDFCVGSESISTSDLPAVLGPEPHGGGHAGVALGLLTSVLRLLTRFLFGLTHAPVCADDIHTSREKGSSYFPEWTCPYI